MTTRLEWTLLPDGWEAPEPEYVPKPVNVPRCDLCGRFASKLFPRYTYFGDILHEECLICKERNT